MSHLVAGHHEEIEFTFEAWHKDTNMSLDDLIGDATLGLPLARFREHDHFASRESVRLYNERGMASGLLYVFIMWKKHGTKGSLEAVADDKGNEGSKYKINLPSPMSQESSSTEPKVPHGTVTMIVERAVHLIDPNKALHPHITRSMDPFHLQYGSFLLHGHRHNSLSSLRRS